MNIELLYEIWVQLERGYSIRTKTERLAKQAKFRYNTSLQTVATGVDRNFDKSLLTLDRRTLDRWRPQPADNWAHRSG